MRKYPRFVIVIVIFILFSSAYIYARELEIKIVDKRIEKSKVYTTVSLRGNISYDTVEAIRNGITAKIYITVQLLKNSGIISFGQGTISQKVVSFTISYDVWDNSFVVSNKSKKKVFRLKNPLKITEVIEKSINPMVLPLRSVRGNTKLILRGKVEIQTIKLYPPFGIFLYFFDPWNYESKWSYTDSFTIELKQ